MSTNVNTLFDNRNSDDEESNKSESQIRFESMVRHAIPTIIDIVEEAHAEMLAELAGRHSTYMNHLSKSIRMNERIKGKVFDAFGDKAKMLRYNRFGLFIGGYAILFKKLDRYGRPSNIRTQNSVMLTTQGKLNFVGEPEIIHIGYVVSPTWDSNPRTYAVKIENEVVQWSINLLSIGGSSSAIVPIANTPTSPDDTDDLIVTPRRPQEQNKSTG